VGTPEKDRAVINPDSKEWKEYMAAALMAQFIALPMLADPNEPIPGSDDLEGEDDNG
jgi:hypothetical protein